MSDLLQDPRSAWAIMLVVVIPILIIGFGELEERLRQRDSIFTPVVAIVRRWTIPLFTIWAVTIGLVGLATTRFEVRVLGTAFLFSVAATALRGIAVAVTLLRRRSHDDSRRLPALVLALPRIVVILIAFWFLLDGVWGVDLTSALTALGVTSLVVSFALQDTLSGLASGFLLLGDAPFQPGDWIRFGELEGKVVDMNWRSSRIEDRNGDLVIVPNSQLAGASLVNYDHPARTHRIVVPVQVAFANPPSRAREMLLDAARSTRGVLDDPPSTVRVVQIDDPLMGYEVDLWIDDFSIAPRVSSEFGSLVWYMSERHGVPLPSPAYDVFMYSGPDTAASGRIDTTELKRRLTGSVLLSQLPEEDIDRLVAKARAVRYAAGEEIVAADSGMRDLYVFWSGRAQVVVPLPAGSVVQAAELGGGDLYSPIGRIDGISSPRVVAVTDCELIIVDESAAGTVASRNPALSEVLNQLAATRQRRIERMVRNTGSRDPADDADWMSRGMPSS